VSFCTFRAFHAAPADR